MSYHLLSTNTWQTGNKQSGTLIHILDDNSLLGIFYFCWPLILDENEASNDENLGGQWNRERWWYRLVHVCRRWRYLVLQSPSSLRLSLLCTRRTPVADMLANSPPLPLIIDHLDEDNDSTTTEDEEGIILALQNYDRVRRIRLRNPILKLQKAIIALDGEFQILEYLLIHHKYPRPTRLNIPETFRAPNLRHLSLMGFDIQIESPILTTMRNLVTLNLDLIPFSAYFQPNDLLLRISLMPQLEILRICFISSCPGSDVVERQLLRAPIMTHVTLPKLRWFGFEGANAYLEAVLPWVNFPLLGKLQVYFFNQMTYSIPHLKQYISASTNFHPIAITLTFHEYCFDVIARSPEALTYSLSTGFLGSHLDWQVASAAQVFHMLGTVFSAVEHLTLRYRRRLMFMWNWNNEGDRTHWRDLLGSFSKVKAILVDDELVGQLSRSLRPGEGDSAMELLPELHELSYDSTNTSHDAFTQFIDARQKAGHPVTVTRC